MNDKGRSMLRIIAGGYLAYLGVDLLKNTITGKTNNPVMFGGFGAAFLVIGVGYIIYSLKRNKVSADLGNELDVDETKEECHKAESLDESKDEEE